VHLYESRFHRRQRRANRPHGSLEKVRDLAARVRVARIHDGDVDDAGQWIAPHRDGLEPLAEPRRQTGRELAERGDA
jgi:hypothetical protein